jgi:hypothetical protein
MHGTERFKTSRTARSKRCTANPTNCYAPTVRRFTEALLNEEVTDMYFTKTKLARSTIGATLLVSLLLSTPAFATEASEATLSNNERAAQNAIADSPTYGASVQSGSAEATLASNELAAQHAITDTSAGSDFGRITPVSGAIGEATLLHNELSAQHAIADAPASSRFSNANRSSAAVSPSTSNQPAAAR